MTVLAVDTSTAHASLVLLKVGQACVAADLRAASDGHSTQLFGYTSVGVDVYREEANSKASQHQSKLIWKGSIQCSKEFANFSKSANTDARRADSLARLDSFKAPAAYGVAMKMPNDKKELEKTERACYIRKNGVAAAE